MVVNAMCYNGEEDMLELHLEMMSPFVDQFILVEGHETFNGYIKPLYYPDQEKRFEKWKDKIKYVEITKEQDYPNNPELLKIADASPNVPPEVEHWRREFYKKELLKDALKGLNDEDTVIIGDVDEILEPEVYRDWNKEGVWKIKVRVYVYWLNNSSNEVFYGPIVSKYKYIKDGILNHLRQFEHTKTEEYGGYHFTNMGGKDEIVRKVRSAYDEFEHLHYELFLEGRIMTNKDYIGRDFELKVDESNWPLYLKENRQKYINMLK